MRNLPQRHSLIDETAAVLRQRLDANEWTVHLPGELELASLLQVGRNTLRSALRLLEEEGLLRSRNGVRREIVLRRGPVAAKRRAVILMSKPENEFPPSTSAWIGDVRDRLENDGWTFQARVEPAVFRGKATSLLRSLTRSSPETVWILHRSTPSMQHWFQEGGIPTVLAGSRHEGITLPQVEVDLRAVSCHAAGRFLSRGHRHLAILRPEGLFAGDAECVAAFREGAPRAEVADLRYRAGTPGVVAALRGLMKRTNRPTGLYVLHSDACVTALSALQHEGVRIPQDLSLICREDETYLGFLHPVPSRYRHNTRTFALRLSALVARLELRDAGPRKVSLVMPRSIEGTTLGKAPILE